MDPAHPLGRHPGHVRTRPMVQGSPLRGARGPVSRWEVPPRRSPLQTGPARG